MKPVFCGNFDYETRHSELERLFSKYGRVDRVDMKSGTSKANRALFGLIMSAKTLHAKEILLPPDHQPLPFTIGIVHFLVTSIDTHPYTAKRFAFIYYDHERDAEDAIRALDNIPFGYSRRRLSVEWSRQADRGSRHRDGSRGAANVRPTKTLFVINFDPINTRIRDIERHFSPYGKILHVRIRRNFAFVQFDTQEEATKALEATNMSKLMDRVVSVEYALRDDNERDVRDSPRRGGGYVRRDSPYGRSVSPVCRSRPSPDYGPARSPAYDRRDGPSRERSRSPEYDRYRSRSPARRSRT